MDRIKFLFFFLVLINVNGCAISARSIQGHVVDAETGEPVPDVIVIVAWRVLTGFHGQTKGFLVLDETVTDERGYYFLPGWKGKHVGFFAALDDSSPELNYFKYGYNLKFESNAISPLRSAPVNSPRESIWNGRKVKLQPFHGNDTERFRELSGIDSYFIGHWGCTAWRLPFLTREIKRLRALAKKMPQVGNTGLPVIDPRNEVICTYPEK